MSFSLQTNRINVLDRNQTGVTSGTGTSVTRQIFATLTFTKAESYNRPRNRFPEFKYEFYSAYSAQPIRLPRPT